MPRSRRAFPRTIQDAVRHGHFDACGDRQRQTAKCVAGPLDASPRAAGVNPARAAAWPDSQVERPPSEGLILETLPKPTGVIVADDDPLIRSILKGKLESLDQDVHLAHNGQEAVDLARRIEATLIVLDIKMPRLDGIAACEAIRKLPGHEQTPIVMLTFSDNERAQAAASRAGATMFLVKPFGSAALMLALSRFLPIDDNVLREIQDTAIRAAGGRVFARMRS